MDLSPQKRQKIEDTGDDSSKQSEAVVKPDQTPRIPDYDRSKHSEAENLMETLRVQWNNLDTTKASSERSNYKKDMCSDRGGWKNPNGEDDRERFSKIFFQLLPSERNFFRDLCYDSRDSFSISRDEIEQHFRYRQEPFFVDENKLEMNADDSDNYRDGSERYPFYSLQEAKVASEKFDFFRVICRPTCVKKKCIDPTCKTYLCTAHGEGIAIYHEHKECFMPDLECICYDCGILVCNEHSEKILKECQSCERRESISGRLGEYYGVDVSDQMPKRVNYLCRGKCGKICGKIDEDCEEEDEEEVDSDNTGFYFDEYGYGYDKKVCRLLCCEECLEVDHNCFHDPREYI